MKKAALFSYTTAGSIRAMESNTNMSAVQLFCECLEWKFLSRILEGLEFIVGNELAT